MFSFFLYISVIVMPDGVVKTYTETLETCPTTEYVMSYHNEMIQSGEIVDWRARCTAYEFDLNVSPKGTAT